MVFSFFNNLLNLLLCRVGDIHHRQHTENKCLHHAGEPVEVDRRNRRKTYRQDRDLRQHTSEHTRKQSQQLAAGQSQGSVNQCVDNYTGKNITEMTAGQANRRSQLRQHIERRHDGNRRRKTLQIPANTACLNLLGGNHNEYHDRPGSLCGKIRRRASKTD